MVPMVGNLMMVIININKIFREKIFMLNKPTVLLRFMFAHLISIYLFFKIIIIMLIVLNIIHRKAEDNIVIDENGMISEISMENFFSTLGGSNLDDIIK